MKRHGAVLDIAGRLVHLDSPMYGEVILHIPAVSHIKASLHHVVELKLKDMPGMPPERAIEFKIELQPSTAPISKALYKMSRVELKELKIQMQGLLDKGYIRPSICLECHPSLPTPRRSMPCRTSMRTRSHQCRMRGDKILSGLS
jgi:hypothetical protein